jgi:ribonuclease P protein component
VRHTIKSAAEISLLFETAHKRSTRTLMVMIRRNDGKRGSMGRVAFIAGKRLGNAPRRNRAKRILREAARQAGAPWRGLDVVFVAREDTVKAPFEVLVEDIRRLMSEEVLSPGAARRREGSARRPR